MAIPAWVSTNAPICRPDEDVHAAIRKLRRWCGDSLPVCDNSRQLVGSISMRSVCLYADASGKRLADIQVREASEPETPACTPGDRATDVMRRMTETGQWCLPMVGRNHALIGMVRFQALLDSVGGDADTIRIVSTAACDEAASLLDVGFRGWRIRESSRELESPSGGRQHLTRAEFKLLLVFANNTGNVLTRDKLMHSVCNRDWNPSDRYIDVLVSNLRRKFGERASSARAFLTVQNEGYLFTLRVQSPLTRPQTIRSQRNPRSGALVPWDWRAESNGAALDHPQPISLDEVYPTVRRTG
jgi:DNA-binding winged helix-turn-helix (wHTH) protein/CBS domain-containing protein